MVKKQLLAALCCLIHLTTCNYESTEWAVVGAGPAGITTVGLLLDAGIEPNQITWIDPEFNVGWLGNYCDNVPANVKTRLFVEFILACNEFCSLSTESIKKLFTYEPEKEYELFIILDPLRDITHHLLKKINSIQAKVTSLAYHDLTWHVGTAKKQIFSKKVILATGSHPRTLDYDCDCQIPLHDALDKERLKHYLEPDDTIGVIGGSHSAILILKHLHELATKRIINFYKNPIVYPVDMGDWELHASAGLRGETAYWAKNVLEKEKPANILRLKNSKKTRTTWLPICDKIIYACGFERNDLPQNDNTTPYECYDCTNGSIAPGLFGIGIAFPEKWEDPHGNIEYGIGIPDFMEYVQDSLPSWMRKKQIRHLLRFNQLVTIKQL